MRKPPTYERYLAPTEREPLAGFSAIAHHFWRTAERIRHEAMEATKGRSWPVDWTVHSAICLYHAALDGFINETIAFAIALGGPAENGHHVQGNTLNVRKLRDFFSYFGLESKVDQKVLDRVKLLAELRNRLGHHWPEMRDIRDYPRAVVAALNDAGITPVNTTWTAQCADVRLAEWSANVVHDFVSEWWRIGRRGDDLEQAHWAFGPELMYPEPSD